MTSTLRCFASVVSPPVKRPTTLFFHSRSFATSICGLPKLMPGARHVFSVFDDFRSVQQRLRWNAADIQTHAAQLRPSLDQGRLHAEIGCAKRRGVAAGTCAEHDDVEVVCRRSEPAVAARQMRGSPGRTEARPYEDACSRRAVFVSKTGVVPKQRSLPSASAVFAGEADSTRSRIRFELPTEITLPFETRSPFFTATDFTRRPPTPAHPSSPSRFRA